MSTTGQSASTRTSLVAVFVESNAQKVELLEDPAAHLGTVLTDAAGQDDAIDTAHGGRVGADVTAHGVGIDGDGQAGAVVSGRRLLLDVPQVVAKATEAGQTALAVEDAIRFVDAELADQLQNGPRIEVATAGAHDQALEGRQPHRGLDRGPELDGTSTGAVAEMQGNQAQLADVPLEVGRGRLRDESMGRAVEAVSTDAETLCKIDIEGVVFGPAGQPAVKGGVEHRDMRQGRQRLAGDADAGEVRRVVQWRERNTVLDRGNHRVVDQGGVVEALAAVHHPVANRFGFEGLRPARGLRRRPSRGSAPRGRSARRTPVCGASPVAVSISWYLTLDDPQLMTRTFMRTSFCFRLGGLRGLQPWDGLTVRSSGSARNVPPTRSPILASQDPGAVPGAKRWCQNFGRPRSTGHGDGASTTRTTRRSSLSFSIPCGTSSGATSNWPARMGNRSPSSRKHPRPSSTW